MTYNELQSMFSGEVKILFVIYLLVERIALAITKRIVKKTKHLANEVEEGAFGIFEYDLNDMHDFSATNIIIANRYAFPRDGKVGEK